MLFQVRDGYKVAVVGYAVGVAICCRLEVGGGREGRASGLLDTTIWAGFCPEGGYENSFV